MTKNNRKKAVAQAISTAVALCWAIMQVESAQAATLTVNNLNDSGVGSLRDTINMATSNDVVEFLLGNHPSTITLTSGAIAIAKNLTINGPGANLLTITGNNQFPVFDISAANVTLYGLGIAGNFNAYNFSNITFTNNTINGDNVNIDSNLTLINSTISSKRLVINGGLTGINDSNVTALNSITIGGNLTAYSGNLTISTGRLDINGGINNSGAAGNITITADSVFVRNPGSQVTIPISTVNGNSGQINDSSNNSGAGGNIILITHDLLLTRVPEPSAIAGIILAGSLAWLAKKKQAAFRKAKV
ncbi:PEP-CTERM sorting domain-containing protein [Nostoc sp.]|uniref:PEP-CTERM sorting domain-containing protein n=1 Tax=Nostoc sp. TaxID=1180 RepID=UPI002FF8FFEF